MVPRAAAFHRGDGHDVWDGASKCLIGKDMCSGVRKNRRPGIECGRRSSEEVGEDTRHV